MDKRSDAEKEKYQPSYECTVLTEIPVEQIMQPPPAAGAGAGAGASASPDRDMSFNTTLSNSSFTETPSSPW